MDKIALAARNNAHLYERICAAHGCRTVNLGELLLCMDPPPRFYSQAVVLKRGASAHVCEHVEGGFKDSFHDIEPLDSGHRLLFSAEWIWKEPGPAVAPELEWNRVEQDSELLAWEVGWATGDPDAAKHPRQFPPSLLACPDLEFWKTILPDGSQAGVMFNLTPPVVGVSNFFASESLACMVWRDLPNLIARQFPNMAAAGYEHGESLDLARAYGFESIGLLRVWTR